MPPTLHEIPVEQIQVFKRQRKELGELGDLIADIKVNGQLQPGIVRPVVADDVAKYDADPSVPWVLVAGERRYRSVIMAGVDTYLAINRGELPELTQKVWELTENLFRKEMTWDEQAQARREIHELRVAEAESRGERWTLGDTARELRETGATISRDIQVAKAIEADPSLRGSGTKAAAVRIIGYREHLERERAQLTRGPSARVVDLLACEDARVWIRRQDTGSVSAVISDFPYGGDFHKLGMKNKPGVVQASDYDDTEVVTLDFFVDMVPEVIRVTKLSGWIAIFMSESNYDYLQELFETCCTTHYEYGEVIWEQQESGDWKKKMPDTCIVNKPGCSFLRAEVPGWIWYRPNSQNMSRFPERHAKNFYENILVLNRGQGRLYKLQNECPNVLVFDSEYGSDRIHSMQKPRAIGRELAARLTLPGEVVCDPCYGSGNLLAGAAEIQRKIRGCENNPLMYEQSIVNVSKYYGG